jgi:hypothetical protein
MNVVFVPNDRSKGITEAPPGSAERALGESPPVATLVRGRWRAGRHTWERVGRGEGDETCFAHVDYPVGLVLVWQGKLIRTARDRLAYALAEDEACRRGEPQRAETTFAGPPLLTWTQGRTNGALDEKRWTLSVESLGSPSYYRSLYTRAELGEWDYTEVEALPLPSGLARDAIVAWALGRAAETVGLGTLYVGDAVARAAASAPPPLPEEVDACLPPLDPTP